MTRLVILALALFALAGPAHAQGPALDALQPGARLRLTPSSGPAMTGALLGVRRDAILVQPWQSADTVTVALDALRRVELSLGQRRRTFRGAALGYLTGLAAGGLAGYLLLDAGQPSDSNLNGIGMAMGASVGALTGLVTGIVIGRRPVERWGTVRIGGASE